MDYKTVTITKEGIETVKRHLSRFGKSSQNEKAIKRLEDISKVRPVLLIMIKSFILMS